MLPCVIPTFLLTRSLILHLHLVKKTYFLYFHIPAHCLERNYSVCFTNSGNFRTFYIWSPACFYCILYIYQQFTEWPCSKCFLAAVCFSILYNKEMRKYSYGTHNEKESKLISEGRVNIVLPAALCFNEQLLLWPVAFKLEFQWQESPKAAHGMPLIPSEWCYIYCAW